MSRIQNRLRRLRRRLLARLARFDRTRPLRKELRKLRQEMVVRDLQRLDETDTIESKLRKLEQNALQEIEAICSDISTLQEEVKDLQDGDNTDDIAQSILNDEQFGIQMDRLFEEQMAANNVVTTDDLADEMAEALESDDNLKDGILKVFAEKLGSTRV